MIGVILGLTFRATKTVRSRGTAAVLNAAAIVISVTLGILCLKSLVDSLIRHQPFAARVVMNFTAWAADLAVLLLSLPICMTLDGILHRKFPRLVAGNAGKDGKDPGP